MGAAASCHCHPNTAAEAPTTATCGLIQKIRATEADLETTAAFLRARVGAGYRHIIGPWGGAGTTAAIG